MSAEQREEIRQFYNKWVDCVAKLMEMYKELAEKDK